MQNNLPPSGQQGDPALQGESVANTEAQLLQNMLTKGVDKDKDEIDDYLATSFLNDQELAVLRDQQEILSRIRRIGSLLQLKNEEWEKASVPGEIVAKMQVLAQTSKSKGGVGFKAVRTEKVVQEQDLYEKQAVEGGEEGAFQKVMDKVGGATGGRQVVGNPDLGSNYGTDPGKW